MAGRIPGKMILDSTVTVAKLSMNADLPMGTHKITGLTAGVNADDAVNKNQLDAVAAGLSWLGPVSVLKIKSDAAQAGSPPTAGATGEAWVVNTWGGGYNDGDIVEWTGTAWAIIVANSGGEPPNATRVLVGASPAGSFAAKADNVAVYDSTANTWSFTAPIDGNAVMVAGETSVYENKQYVYDASAWLQFGGSMVVQAGSGLEYSSGNILAVKPDVTTAGNTQPVTAAANGTGLDVSAIAGVGIEADGSANLRLAAQGNGITGGAGSTLSVLAENTSVAVGAGGVKAAVPSANNKNMTAEVTDADEHRATATALASTPAAGSMIDVYINGVRVNLRPAKDGDCYFSADSGSTARAFAAIVATDELYWRRVTAGYELDAADKIDLEYNVA